MSLWPNVWSIQSEAGFTATSALWPVSGYLVLAGVFMVVALRAKSGFPDRPLKRAGSAFLYLFFTLMMLVGATLIFKVRTVNVSPQGLTYTTSSLLGGAEVTSLSSVGLTLTRVGHDLAAKDVDQWILIEDLSWLNDDTLDEMNAINSTQQDDSGR